MAPDTAMIHAGTFFTARRPEEVFDRLADPQWFAPLLPDFESLVVLDATHFILRIVIAVGQIQGHANLAMEAGECVRPSRIEFHGMGIVARSQLSLNLQFQIAASGEATEVNWRGELSLDGMLALMASHLLEPMGGKNFELMAERLQNGLGEDQAAGPSAGEVNGPGRPQPDDYSQD
jgi:uncharacterized protein